MPRVAIIVGSTRPGRLAETVAHWVHDIAAKRGDAEVELLDIAAYQLPLLDEPHPAAHGPQHYSQPHTRAWAAAIDAFDGYVFVTPEYNHSIPAALKNAIDFLFAEWHHKSAGFVSYGLHGGTRAVEHLRQVMAELQVADVRSQVELSLFTDFAHGTDITTPTEFTPASHQEPTLTALLDQVVVWAEALTPLRDTVAAS